jgi:hypothetical protein
MLPVSGRAFLTNPEADVSLAAAVCTKIGKAFERPAEILFLEYTYGLPTRGNVLLTAF